MKRSAGAGEERLSAGTERSRPNVLDRLLGGQFRQAADDDVYAINGRTPERKVVELIDRLPAVRGARALHEDTIAAAADGVEGDARGSARDRQRKALRPVAPMDAVDLVDTFAAGMYAGPLEGQMLPAELAVFHMEIVEPVDAHL